MTLFPRTLLDAAVHINRVGPDQPDGFFDINRIKSAGEDNGYPGFFDFDSQKWEEQEYVIYKDLHCWLAELSLEIRDGSFSTWLVFRLKAFPEIPIGLFKTSYHRPHPGGRD